ncbi:DUF2933 domain-containing protein [Noviherbaspirillum sp.]|uniref:DUF2933 domain-containing protein n=1 Tax=Noviherbaspirillum sp. TaxID=1926288 RepID=UPI002FE366D3
MDHSEHHRKPVKIFTRAKWVWIGFAFIAAFFLWTEHRAHLLGAWPFLLILACPLMHLFMHGGHGHHAGHAGHSAARSDKNEEIDRQSGAHT